MMNYHHLRYFWEVAHDGNLSRTARRLRVSQSALSLQIRQLEESFNEALFLRQGKRLVLTEAGRVALTYADTIFQSGSELEAAMKEGRNSDQVFAVGAVATLSRNFQSSFLEPLLATPNVCLRLLSGSLEELGPMLSSHALDVVLSNRAPDSALSPVIRTRRLARQPVSLISSRPMSRFRFPIGLERERVILPGPASGFRAEFDALVESRGISFHVFAEVDDMAMLRRLLLESDAVALVPSIVVRDELKQGILHEWYEVPDLTETFYALTVSRRFEHPLLRMLLDRQERQLLG